MESILVGMIAVITVLALGILLVTARYLRRETAGFEPGSESYRQGYGVSNGIVIGAGFGVALGLAMGHLALGIPIGAAIGAMLGGMWERGNRIRPVTRRERRWFMWLTLVGILVFAAGAVCFMIIR